MKFIPMSFNPLLIPSIRKRKKTMTRRLAKVYGLTLQDQIDIQFKGYVMQKVKCPYQVGDVIWVKEQHFAYGFWMEKEGEFNKFGRVKKTFVDMTGIETDTRVYYPDDPPMDSMRACRDYKTAWHQRLARYMPKRYCRTFMEIINIRLERLQEITEVDAAREGMNPNLTAIMSAKPEEFKTAHTAEFIRVFQHLHGENVWAVNPWVWVLTFHYIDKPTNWPNV